MLLSNVRHMARRPVFSAFNRPQSRKGNLLMYVRKDFHKSTGFIQIMDDALARHPDLEAIVYGGWRMTYREFGSCINRAAHMLLALGLGKGSPAAIISRNCPEFLILEFALYKIGAVPVKINWRLSPREMIGQLDASGAGHAFLRAEREDWGRELVGHYGGSLRFFDMSGDRRENSSFMQAIAGYPDEELSVEMEDSDPACHIHTSGTTGMAKTVVYTHGSILDKISAVKELYGYCEGDRLQFVSQLFHSAAIGAWLCFCTSGTLVLMSSFSTDKYMASLEHERINAISVIPTILKWILDELDKKDYDLSALRVIRYSTCPVPQPLLERALDRFHCEFYQSYGMTEMGSMVTILPPEDHLRGGSAHLATVGRPIPGTELAIMGEDGKLCAPGETGEILIKGPGVMQGYFGQPVLTESRLKNGWYHSGDMGSLGEDGYLTLSGRIDDLIISGGENIYPLEISNVLMELGDVTECCAFGVPDEVWGEHVKACVVLAPGSRLTVEELFRYCQQHMPHFKAPKEIEILPALPKNASGKVLIQPLRAGTWPGDAKVKNSIA